MQGLLQSTSPAVAQAQKKVSFYPVPGIHLTLGCGCQSRPATPTIAQVELGGSPQVEFRGQPINVAFYSSDSATFASTGSATSSRLSHLICECSSEAEGPGGERRRAPGARGGGPRGDRKSVV